jgi:hypothetical protein
VPEIVPENLRICNPAATTTKERRLLPAGSQPSSHEMTPRQNLSGTAGAAAETVTKLILGPSNRPAHFVKTCHIEKRIDNGFLLGSFETVSARQPYPARPALGDLRDGPCFDIFAIW